MLLLEDGTSSDSALAVAQAAPATSNSQEIRYSVRVRSRCWEAPVRNVGDSPITDTFGEGSESLITNGSSGLSDEPNESDGTIGGNLLRADIGIANRYFTIGTGQTTTESNALSGSNRSVVGLPGTIVLDSGLFVSQFASTTAYTTFLSPKIPLPTRADMIASGSRGIIPTRITLVVRTITAQSIFESAVVLGPRPFARPSLKRPHAIAAAQSMGDVHLVANIQPLTVTAGSSPLQVQASSALPMFVAPSPGAVFPISSSNPLAVSGSLTVDTTQPLRVCGSPFPYEPVFVSTRYVSGTGIYLERPLSVTTRPGVDDIPPTRYIVPTGGNCPMSVTSDVPWNGMTGNAYPTIGPLQYGPIRSSAVGGTQDVNVVNSTPIDVTIGGGSAVEVVPAEKQTRPFWVSEVDFDND